MKRRPYISTEEARKRGLICDYLNINFDDLHKVGTNLYRWLDEHYLIVTRKNAVHLFNFREIKLLYAKGVYKLYQASIVHKLD